ncbi:bacteriocin-like protein, partial [Elizabethkingia miricola]|uniref:bacteriocin-like protein n=1 Tax=Elizabethkingia miricola TaxID=172045 RepID=UPI001CA3D7F3
ICSQPIKYYTMKNLKRINRSELKSLLGGGNGPITCPSGYKRSLCMQPEDPGCEPKCEKA